MRGIGLAEGFMQGYDFMDRAMDRQDRRERREVEREREDEMYRLRKEALQEQNRQRKVAREREDEMYRLRKEALQEQNRQRKVARLMNVLQYERQNMGGYQPETLSAFMDAARTSPEVLLSEDTDRAIDVLKETAAGRRPRNSPESLTALNQVMGPMINRGAGEQTEDGGQILDKKIVGVHPTDEGKHLGFQLAVRKKRKDGKEEVYQAPVTRDRSSREDDPVVEVPVQNAMGYVVGIDGMRRVVKADPEMEKALTRLAIMNGFTPEQPEAEAEARAGWALADLGDGRFVMYNKYTGERRWPSKEELDRAGIAPGVGGGGGGRLPADAQMVEYLMQKGIAETPEEAYQLTKMAVTSPQDFVVEYVSDRMKAQRDGFIMPDSPEYRTQDELIREGVDVYKEVNSSIRNLYRDNGAAEPPPPGGVYRQMSDQEPSPPSRPKVEQMVQPPQGAPENAIPAPTAAIEALRAGEGTPEQFREIFGWVPDDV